MSEIHFCPIPEGPLPLYVAPRRERGVEEAVLCFDLLTRRVWLDPSDPFEDHTAAGGLRVMSWGVEARVASDDLARLYDQIQLDCLLERVADTHQLRLGAQGWEIRELDGATQAYQAVDALLQMVRTIGLADYRSLAAA